MENIISKKEMDNIINWCELIGITEYEVNKDGSIDVLANVLIEDTLPNNMTELPIKINIIHGDFMVEYDSLRSMLNMPEIVNGDFICNNNEFTSLIGCPKYIKGNFDFSYNNIQSLYVGDYDVEIGGEAYCSNNKFTLGLILGINGVNEEEFENSEYYDPYEDINDQPFDSHTIKMILKYQNEFKIWNKDLSLAKDEFLELMNEINLGILK